MVNKVENRTEKRLRYSWPIWFAEDFNDTLSQGQMVDISSNGASFTCYADKCPHSGGHITARFSVPRYGENDTFDLENFVRQSSICRVDELSPFVRRVAIRFSESLSFKPGEIDDTEALAVDETIIDNVMETEALAMAENVNANMPEQTAKETELETVGTVQSRN